MATVLVVDDEPMMLRMVKQVLTQDGFSVFTAEGPAQAVSLFRSHPRDIDLLVSDVRMPGMDGASLAAALQAQRPGLPVLLMSGYCEPEQTEKGFEFLAKPFSILDLLARVRRLSSVRQAVQSA